MQPLELPGFSWTVFLTLTLIFVVSMAVFFVLVRRWTLHRDWIAVSEWAHYRRFRHRPADEMLPAPLDDTDLKAQLVITSGTITFVDFAAPAIEPGQERVHILHRRMELPFDVAALRPIDAPVSFIDRFKLNPYPLITENDRFLALGVDSAAARRVALVAKRLLPPDLGLLMHGQALVIDFSSRPFDTIEFDRLIALSDQLVSQFARAAAA